MDNHFLIKTVDIDRWNLAQKWEHKVWRDLPTDSEDYNAWWMNNFDKYYFLNGFNIKSILEVGCGPWAKNLRNILKIIGEKDKDIYLEDPLLDMYIKDGKSVKDINATKISVPLEQLNIDKKMDLIICINVLDHVYSVEQCFDSIYKHLNPGGILIFANDLTNEDDYKTLPIADVGHPIRIDLDVCDSYLSKLTQVYRKVLSREDGRNPACHYATLLYAGILR